MCEIKEMSDKNMAGKSIRFLEKSSVKLNFTKKLMTPYGGFAMLANLFKS